MRVKTRVAVVFLVLVIVWVASRVHLGAGGQKSACDRRVEKEWSSVELGGDSYSVTEIAARCG